MPLTPAQIEVIRAKVMISNPTIGDVEFFDKLIQAGYDYCQSQHPKNDGEITKVIREWLTGFCEEWDITIYPDHAEKDLLVKVLLIFNKRIEDKDKEIERLKLGCDGCDLHTYEQEILEHGGISREKAIQQAVQAERERIAHLIDDMSTLDIEVSFIRESYEGILKALSPEVKSE
jgi:hypothetical protein